MKQPNSSDTTRLVRLVIQTGPDAGHEMPMQLNPSISIGRGEDCDVQLHDLAVSRLHCVLCVEDGSLALRDADSRWGTQVNGRSVRKAVLKLGDLITVGETRILVDALTVADMSTLAPRPVPAADRDPHAAAPADVSSRTVSNARHGISTAEQILTLRGQRFLRFEIGELIASARTGAVFQARDGKRGCLVALKLFWPHCFQRDDDRRRFIRAMRSAIPLRHEHLVRIITAGRSQGVCFTGSEFVAGDSAAALIERIGICGMFDWRRVLRIGLDLAEALEAAAAYGLVHRNITPRNILIRSSDGVAKLNDLVLAKATTGTCLEQLTRPGEVLGELAFASPEQIGSLRPVDIRSDIYSLGASLYALLTGRPPLEGHTAADTIQRIQDTAPKPPTAYHLSVSPLLEGEILRMLEKRPEDRHASPAVLKRELLRVARYENLESNSVVER